jgi:hypothetical protein
MRLSVEMLRNNGLKDNSSVAIQEAVGAGKEAVGAVRPRLGLSDSDWATRTERLGLSD